MASKDRTVAIVGRPNVGKSALFNRLAGRKISIVHDQPGVTRDRISAECKLGVRRFNIFDTGGIGTGVDATFSEQVRTEADIAIETSAVLLLVVDGQQGLNPVDIQLARHLRKTKKPLVLVVNKLDHEKHRNYDAEFTRLGFEHIVSTSAEHGLGLSELLENIEELLPPESDQPEADDAARNPTAVAVVGRPNVGKSSLINSILQDARTLVSHVSGTTRDAVDIPYSRNDKTYVLIDTAGIRPKGKRDSSVEIFSVMRSERTIKRADLCVLVIDAVEGVTAQDKKIAGLIQQANKPCVIAVNKWDLLKWSEGGRKDTLKAKLKEVRDELFFLDYAPLLLVSAKTGEQMSRLFRFIEQVRVASRKTITTGQLNRLLQTVMTNHPPPIQSGRRLKLLYGTMADSGASQSIPTPTIILFVNDSSLLTQTYRRYLEARVREIEPYTGLPIQFKFRDRK